MNWIKLPLAWRVQSGSTLLASVCLHGLLLVLPLAAEKKPPKPDTLAAVPITELPAAPKIDVATKPPEPEPTVESLPEPEEPSFDRVVWRDRSAFRDRSSFPQQQEEFVEPVEDVESVEETEEAIEESSNLQSVEPEETDRKTPQKELISDRSSNPNSETPPKPLPAKPPVKTSDPPPTPQEIQEKAGVIIQQTSQKIEDNAIKMFEKDQETAGEEESKQIGSILTKEEDILNWLYIGNPNLKNYLFDENDRLKPDNLMIIAKQGYSLQKIYDEFVDPYIKDFVDPHISEKKLDINSQPSQNQEGMIYQVEIDEIPYYSVEVISIKQGDKIFGTIVAFWNPAPE